MLPTIHTDDLGPTATYSWRSYVWFGAVGGMISHRRDGALELIPAIGKLTIKLQRGLRHGCKVEVDTYAVEEVEAEEVGTRLFVLLNLTDATQREPYKVTLGGVNRCRCIAGIVNRHECKHFAALSNLLAAGVLGEAVGC